jgi:site-specific DNA-cytosine methylase
VTVAGTLKGQRGKGGGGIGPEETLVAAPLSHGSNPNSNMAGRRREDDFNLVPMSGMGNGKITGTLKGFGERGWDNSAESADRLVVGASVRRLTPRECERLQGLPDDWTKVPDTAPDSRRYAALGDAVTASVGEWIGRRLMAAAHLGARVAA